MSDLENILKEFFENSALYTPITLEGRRGWIRAHKLREIQADCPVCDTSKPFHNEDGGDHVIYMTGDVDSREFVLSFKCVTCKISSKKFWVKMTQIDNDSLQFQKIGQDPQKELPRSRALSKFFKEDKHEYNKAVICLANGYGVAAFVYMRRVIEKNINRLLDLINENVDSQSSLAQSLAKLKTTSPMSDKIEIANQALPDYLKPDGFNPLGQIYGLLSDGVHSLPDEQCLDKAQDLQACLEFLISELAAHKKNKEDFKSRLSSLRKR